MPTGFTCIIDDKPETTFREFALRCVRGMSVCMRMRDESVDVPAPQIIEPETWHRDKLTEARARLERLLERTSDEDKKQQCTETNRRRQKEYTEYTTKDNATSGRYLAMLAKVKEWVPPTPEHQNFQKFMTEQLVSGGSLDSDYVTPVPAILTPEEWFVEAVTQAQHDIKYHEEHWCKEQENCAAATAWLKSLYASLPEEK
jgi:hypothetical protein